MSFEKRKYEYRYMRDLPYEINIDLVSDVCKKIGNTDVQLENPDYGLYAFIRNGITRLSAVYSDRDGPLDVPDPREVDSFVSTHLGIPVHMEFENAISYVMIDGKYPGRYIEYNTIPTGGAKL